jgi:hypothetical protein
LEKYLPCVATAYCDKVIQTENDYDKDVFNGDVGIVERIDTVDQQVGVRFDERLVKYELRGIGRDFSGLRDHDPQVAGIGVPGSSDPARHAALHATAT